MAQEAGVGIATLYRHFPNRQSLAEAVYERIFSTEIEPLLVRLTSTDAPPASSWRSRTGSPSSPGASVDS
uniref:TetR/AcrR family transcriptional regulator n=1 Tax=Streptomyces fuscichromogenes TaxID=1324013 RepID=UPI001E4DCE5A|nr:TetR/AcrR family transcriptional regulator [Streptomyces fuscichromogenes]